MAAKWQVMMRFDFNLSAQRSQDREEIKIK